MVPDVPCDLPDCENLKFLAERLKRLDDQTRAMRDGLTATADRLLGGQDTVSEMPILTREGLVGKLHEIVDDLFNRIEEVRAQAYRLSTL